MSENEKKLKADLNNASVNKTEEEDLAVESQARPSRFNQAKLKKQGGSSPSTPTEAQRADAEAKKKADAAIAIKAAETQKTKDIEAKAQKDKEARDAEKKLQEEAKAKEVARLKAEEDARKAAEVQAKAQSTATQAAQPAQPPNNKPENASSVAKHFHDISQQYHAAGSHNRTLPAAQPIVKSPPTSPSLKERASEVNTSVSETHKHKYSQEEKNAITEAVRKYDCTAEFPNNLPAKISGPASKLIQALQNCGNPEFSKGPFTLNFKVDLENPVEVKAVSEKINKLLETAMEAGVSIPNITVNGKPDTSGSVNFLKNNTNGNIARVMFTPPSPEDKPKSKSGIS